MTHPHTCLLFTLFLLLPFLAGPVPGQDAPDLTLVRRVAPDQTISVQVPDAWVYSAGKGMFETNPGGRAPQAGICWMAYTVLSPRYEMPVEGALFSDYRSPGDAVVWLIGQAGYRDARLSDETPDPILASHAGRFLGRTCEAATVEADVTTPEGVECHLFAIAITTAPLPYSGSWIVTVQACWAPKGEFASYAPAYHRILGSVEVDVALVQDDILERLKWLNRRLEHWAWNR